MNSNRDRRTDLRRELRRKAVHFTGLLYLLPAKFLDAQMLFYVTTLSFIFSLVVEYFRRRLSLFSWAVREYEEKGIPAYVFFSMSIFVISSLVVLGILSTESFIIAILSSILGDGIAGIVKRATDSKNLGSISMFLSVLIAARFLSLPDLPSAISVLICVLVERIDGVSIGGKRRYVDDNLLVPLSAAFSYPLLNFAFYRFPLF